MKLAPLLVETAAAAAADASDNGDKMVAADEMVVAVDADADADDGGDPSYPASATPSTI